MLRQARLDAPGTFHRVMIRGIERSSIFAGVKTLVKQAALGRSLAMNTIDGRWRLSSKVGNDVANARPKETPMNKFEAAKRLCFILVVAGLLLGNAGNVHAQQVQQVKANRVKELLRAGKPALGAIVSLPCAPAAQVLAQAGFDWLWIDMEHGPINLETAHGMIQATQGTEAVPVVRVPWNLHWLAKPVLDAGAMGIVFPFIRSRQEAIDAVQAVRYPPEGVRGFSPAFAALRWGLSVPEYVKAANREIMAILLIEHIDAVGRIDEILSVPGVDLAFIGPFDLSGSMGLLGQITHPREEEAIQKVLAAAKRAKVPAGILAVTPEDVNRRLQQGFQFIMVGADTAFLTAGAKGILSQVKR
jgi:4-hydroxy-2-oxoheptanedioate aldolase